MWEGDHALRKPGNLGHNVPPDVGRMETIQFVVQEKQRAVDNAKKDFGDACQNVCCPAVRLIQVHGSYLPYVQEGDTRTLARSMCNGPQCSGFVFASPAFLCVGGIKCSPTPQHFHTRLY
jgi:hypothetical protein